MDLEEKRRTLETLRAQVRELEREVAEEEARTGWRATGHYPAYYATSGSLLGIFGASISLLYNVAGAAIFGKNPLELIRVYLTFPLGERALALTDQFGSIYVLHDGVVLAIGCCLYLLTGMVLGVPMTLALAYLAHGGGAGRRLVVASALALALWAVNFYGILSWLQPLLFGGRWIVDSVPWWVGASTHLIFGWTIALAFPFGAYEPYRRPTESLAS